MLLQQNKAKSKPGSRRLMKNNLNHSMPDPPVTPHPRCRLLSIIRHTTRHDAPHPRAGVATQPHCRDPRRATPYATDSHTTRHESFCQRHTTRHESPHRAPQVAMSLARSLHTTRHESFCLLTDGGKPVDNSSPPLGNIHTSGSYPHFVHKLSTSYPHVIHRFKTSHAVRGY